MQFMIRLQPKPELLRDPPADLMEAVAGERAMARAYHARGVLRRIWMNGPGVIALLEAASRAEVEALLAALPLSRAGYVDTEIHELAPYVGFGPDAAGA